MKGSRSTKWAPASTLSGGRLSDFGGKTGVVEYRVWWHPFKGDDQYKRSRSYREIVGMEKKLKAKGEFVEKPLAVVWDDKFGEYREVVIDS